MHRQINACVKWNQQLQQSKLLYQSSTSSRAHLGRLRTFSTNTCVYSSPRYGFASSSSTKARKLHAFMERRKEFMNVKKQERWSDPALMRQLQSQINQKFPDKKFVIRSNVSCRGLALAMGMKATDLLHFLPLDNYTLDDLLTIDMIKGICHQFGLKPVLEQDITAPKNLKMVTPFDGVTQEKGVPRRAPVVTIMGHVDHGKTTLLDTLRNTNVAAREAGGITQHIGAFKVTTNISGEKHTITFIDTPGHEAFTRMRSTGAQVTDIIVLVVAADDGVMPQTVEVINFAKQFDAPIVVAINKIDKSNAQVDRVELQLMNHEIVTEKHGGNVQVVGISALKNINLDKLLEEIILQAEILDLKARRDACPMEATVIEGRVDKGLGLTATVVVRRGTVKPGQYFVAGYSFGRVKSIRDQNLQIMKEAFPGDPVELVGFETMPDSGDIVLQVDNEDHAKRIIEYRKANIQHEKDEEEALQIFEKKIELAALKEELMKKQQADKFINPPKESESGQPLPQKEIDEAELEKQLEDTRPTLPIIIKADVKGALDAFHNIISTFPSDEVKVQVVKEGVGSVTDSDLDLAKFTQSHIICMNVKPANKLSIEAQRHKVPLVHFKVIYHLIDHLKAELTKLLPVKEEEEVTGEIEFKQSFEIKTKDKEGKNTVMIVAGGIVTSGVIKSEAAFYRVIRWKKTLIDNAALVSLKVFKDSVKEVKKGSECAISIEGYNEPKEGDIIQSVVLKKVTRTFDEVIEQKKRQEKKSKK